MIKTIIIDDEPLARTIIKDYLSKHEDFTIVQECNDGFEGVKAIQQHQPELIFLDIQMPKINGFEMLELIEQPPGVIFTTAFDEYAIKAFDTLAIDYLLKPFSKDRFDKALQKWKDQRHTVEQKTKTETLIDTNSKQPEENLRVVVKTGTKIRIIPVNDIIYFEADDDYVKIHTPEGSYLKKKTMQHFENVLHPSQFVRVHRSYIVSVPQITKIESNDKENHVVVLKNNARIPLSKTGYPKLKSILGL